MGIRRRYQEMGYQERGTYQGRGMTVLREGYHERGIRRGVSEKGIGFTRKGLKGYH